MADPEVATQRFQEALNHSSSPVKDRLRAERVLLILYADAKNWPQAHQAAFKTVSGVPLLTPRSLETSDKQYLITKIISLTSIASTIVLNIAKTLFNAI